MKIRTPSAGLILIAYAAAAPAGGPLFVEGADGTTPVTYEDPLITLNLDQGKLGEIHSNDIADQLVVDAIALWNGVLTSTIELRIGDDMPVDVDGSNYTSYIPDPNDSTVHNDSDGRNPVVYDASGAIIDDFFGIGQSANVIGFAASSFFINAAHFTEGFAVINGLDIGQSDQELTLTIAHELGHFFGIDHSQTDIDPDDGLSCVSFFRDDYPLMYPLACRNSYTLHPDDVMAVSSLYPAADFEASHGQISGTFRSAADNQAIRGANLWVSNGSGEVYSVVSDYLQQNTGFFSLFLPPGMYTLRANPVNPLFFGGSSVGPYAQDSNDLSFQPPASDIGDVAYLADLNAVALLTVTAGEAVEVTFYSDGSGSFSEGNVVSNPNLQTPSSDALAHDGSGGGSLSAWNLVVLLAVALAHKVLRKGAAANPRFSRDSRSSPPPSRTA